MSTPSSASASSSSSSSSVEPFDRTSLRTRRALALIADVAGVEVEALEPRQELLADLRIDSPKALRLLMDLEDEFEVEVGDEEAAGLRTVGDVAAFVERLG